MICTKTTISALAIQENPSMTRYPLQGDYTVGVAKDINAVATLWDSLAPAHNIFLQSDYLAALQLHAPEKLGFRYVILYQNDHPVGIAYMQTYFVRMEDSVNQKELPKGVWNRLTHSIRQWFIKRAVFNVLICGNLLLTGQHGYHLSEETLDEALGSDLVRKSVDVVQQLLEKETGKKMHIQMFKDYPCKDKDAPIHGTLRQAAYHQYTIQPSMYIRLPKHWNSFEDYLEEMQSKYRVRARRAAKKGEELTKKELSLAEIEALNPQIYALYKGIATNVEFNAFTLHPEYFLALKKHLGDRYKLVGFFLEDKLVAFCTAIFNGGEMEAHFLGVDHEVNKEYQVYLNILYSLIDMAIYHRMDLIDFARTALEIKSSVGAVPCDLNCYVRHRNRLSSNIMKFVFERLTPEEDWQPRSPFKDMSIVK